MDVSSVMACRGCGQAMRLLLAVFAMLIITVPSVTSASRSCMEEWMVNIGIPQDSAQTYMNKSEFYQTQGLYIESLLYVRHASLLRRLGINRSRHREMILSCSHNPGTCPPDPCFNSGRCRYSQDESTFVCVCGRGWEGARCRQRIGGKITKADMRVLLKQHEQHEGWLERILNTTHTRSAEQADKYMAIIRAQDEELRDLRERMESKEAKTDKRKYKLRVAREKSFNATRDRNICKHSLLMMNQERDRLRRQLDVCRSQLGFSFNARGCGTREDGKDGLGTRGVLHQGEMLVSPDNRLRLTVRSNGTVQAYDERGAVFWSSPDRPHRCLSRRGPYRLVVLPNGEVQTRDNDGCVLWRTNSGRVGEERTVCLLLEDSRRLALYAPCGQQLWTSGQEINRTSRG